MTSKLKCRKCGSKFPKIDIAKKKIIEKLIKDAYWLFQNELEIIYRMKDRFEDGYSLSENQVKLLNEIHLRVPQRQSNSAVFFQGRSPGSIRKR